MYKLVHTHTKIKNTYYSSFSTMSSMIHVKELKVKQPKTKSVFERTKIKTT